MRSKPRSGWCAECPKCLFTAICLSCFITEEALEAIFGVNPFATPNAGEQISELAGFSKIKPFECVGTYQEVRSCLKHLLKKATPGSVLSEILSPLAAKIQASEAPELSTLLKRFDGAHFLSRELEGLLKESLGETAGGFTL
jgi:hypothetical protein